MTETLNLTRRRLLAFAGGALLLPRGVRAQGASDRQMLFVFCKGGWDTSYVFTPLMDSPYADAEPDATVAEVHGLTFVDHPSRPAVRGFFEAYGDRMALLNGFEVRSITHERCTRLLMTGSGEAQADDWAAILAAHDPARRVAPSLVISGPSFTSRHTSQVVRVGPAGQLDNLLSGACFQQMDDPVLVPGDSVLAAVDELVQARSARWAAAAPDGQPAALGASYLAAVERSAMLIEDGGLALGSTSTSDCDGIYESLDVALDAFDLGLSRTATVSFAGRCAVSFDSHSQNDAQAAHFDELFEHLDHVVQGLETRGLQDRVTVVVLSEMGRHPQLNSQMGKDHWTFTSAMLFGAGVRGGQVVGALDGTAMGRPVDLASGEVTDSGVSLLPEHLGATLLALGDVDPGEYTDAEPIAALLSSS